MRVLCRSRSRCGARELGQADPAPELPPLVLPEALRFQSLPAAFPSDFRRGDNLAQADEDTGRRYIVSGHLLPQPRNESLVALGDFGHDGWIIPRRDVVAWFQGDAGELRQLAISLARQGWAPRSAA